jgi:serine phosphatase RsbU (regulator of sigma subunit)
VRAAAPDASTASLRHLRLALSDERLSSLIEISRPQDRHRYFLQVGFDRQGLFAMAVSRLGHVSLLAAAILIGLRILSYGFARRLARPIENLSRSAAEVARGNLAVHLPVETRDEIGTLTHNFNRMVAGLKEREAVRLMEYDMERGRQIQRDFLPRQMPRIPEWDIAAFFDPARQVSGDFYDVFPVDDRRLGLVIADVCDKGLGSAFYMALFRSLIRIYAEQERASWPENDPRQTHLTDDPNFCVRVVQRTNDYVARNHGQEGMFATVFFGLLDPASGRLHYVNAGHEPLYVVGRDGLRTPLNPTGPAVGLMPGMSFRAAREVLAPGEALMGFTDGVVEARSPQDEPYSRNRLQTLLAEPSNSAGALLEKVKESLYRFIDGAPPEDDVTMIAIQRSPAAA